MNVSPIPIDAGHRAEEIDVQIIGIGQGVRKLLHFKVFDNPLGTTFIFNSYQTHACFKCVQLRRSTCQFVLLFRKLLNGEVRIPK